MVLKTIVLGLIGISVALSVYVRFAPIDVALLNSWISLSPPGENTWANGHQVTRETDEPQATLVALDGIIMATPRTTRVAGAVEAGFVSYVTRSALWGFPDLTTIYAGPDDTIEGGYDQLMRIDGRAVYGKSDLGVNRARIEGWLAQLDQDRPQP